MTKRNGRPTGRPFVSGPLPIARRERWRPALPARRYPPGATRSPPTRSPSRRDRARHLAMRRGFTVRTTSVRVMRRVYSAAVLDLVIRRPGCPTMRIPRYVPPMQLHDVNSRSWHRPVDRVPSVRATTRQRLNIRNIRGTSHCYSNTTSRPVYTLGPPQPLRRPLHLQRSTRCASPTPHACSPRSCSPPSPAARRRRRLTP